MKILLQSLLLSLLLLVTFCLSAVPHGKQPACMLDSSCSGQDWFQHSAVPKDEMIQLAFVLKQKNLDVLAKFVAEVSDPENAKYGQYLTFQQLGELVADADAERAVLSWLKQNNVPSTHIQTLPNKELLRVRLSVETAERLLSTTFFRYFSFVGQKSIVRTTEYYLPADMAAYIDYVAYTVQFPPLRKPTIFSVQSKLTGGSTDPALLKSYYNITKDSTTNKRTTQSLFESGQSYNPDDLTTFQKKFSLDVVAVDQVIGPNRPSICDSVVNLCMEANLDVQYIMALAQEANTTFWSVANSEDVFLDWIEAVAANSDPPLVHSISYGSIESESDPSSLNLFDSNAMKLGSRGVSIMVSSGDDGVANYEARSDKSKCGFNPSFPATATYITAVGATQGPEDDSTEIACSSKTGGVITTGGGFSTVFSRPSYQSTVVSSYLKNGPNMPPTSDFASSGRAYPDVAAMGHNYEIVVGGKTYQVSGTSCSSPVFAGMVSLINDLRLNKGKSSLGFLNTALYKAGSYVWNDITSGTNNCCAADDPNQAICCTYGFTATTGWDPLTGFGSPNFGYLADYLVNN